MAALRAEAFLDTTKIEATSGVTYGVERPVKHASNPIAFPTGVATSDPNRNIANNTAVLDPDDPTTTLFFHNSGDSTFTGVVVTYCESSDADGLVLTRPSLGLVTWGGSAANNVIHPAGVGDTSLGGSSQRTICGNVYYDATDDLWVMVARPSAQWASLLYTAPAPTGPWTLAKTVAAAHGSTPARDANHVMRRSDGRWLLYYQRTESGLPQTGAPSGYYQGFRRSLGAFLSDTTSLTGAWTDLGAVITSSTAARQYYGCGGWVDGEMLYLPVGIFDGTDSVPTTTSGSYANTYNSIHKTALYVSRANDGTTFTLADDDWISRTGVYGEWDGGETIYGHNIVETGDEWRYYFGGDTNTHHQSPEGNRYLGLSTLGRRRVGKITGTGTARTTLITASAAGTVKLNSTGTVEAELLDASNNVITGYAQADCDTITAGYDTTVTWNGSSVTPAAFKVKLYLTSGTVYYLTVEEDAGITAAGYGNTVSEGYGSAGAYTENASITIDPASTAWEQVGTAITARVTAETAGPPAARTVQATVNSPSGGLLRFRGTNATSFAASLDGTTFTSMVDVPAGETTVYLAVTPVTPGTTLEAELVF